MSTTVKRIALVLGLCVLVAMLGFGWQYARLLMLQDSCLDSGGKWASNGDYCIRRECAQDSSCKPSYNNNAICRTLKLGIGRDELYFHLGMPESNVGNVYTFTGGGADASIKATIADEKLTVLRCGTD